MKHHFFAIAILLWLLPCIAFSQLAPQYAPCLQCNGNNPTYGDPAAFTTSNIASDYGMRVAGEGASRFHQGIDYGRPTGDAIVSLTAGRVMLLLGDGGLKKIVIDGHYNQNDLPGQPPTNPNGLIFSYLHIFDNNPPPSTGTRSGGFTLINIPTTPVSQAIINLVTHTAIAVAPNVVFNYNGRQYTTTNFVQAGQLIAPIGTSGTPYPHLHLSHLEEGTDDTHLTRSIDPWNQVDHEDNVLNVRLRRRDAAGFQSQVCEFDEGTPVWGTFIPNYADNTRNVLEAEISMPGATTVVGRPDKYTNVVMNESTVSWLLRNVSIGGSFGAIQGLNYTSRYVIDPVGALNIYPPEMFAGRYGGTGLMQNGCMPFAYRTAGDGGFIMEPQHPIGAGHPHDHYFFPDFYLRLHQSHIPNTAPETTLKLASYPWESKYQDGDYAARADVINTDGDIYHSNPINFQIDNFKPFIHKVGLYAGNEQIYYREWTTHNTTQGQLRLGAVTPKNPASLVSQPLIGYVVASEAVSTIRAKIPGLVDNWVTGIEQPNTNGKNWQIPFGIVNFLEDYCYTIVFEGEDLYVNAAGQGNRLLDLPQPYTCNTGTGLTFAVPYRTGTTNASWSNGPPQGTDAVHKFRVGKCQMLAESNGPDCITSNEVTYDVTSAAAQQATGAINMTIVGSNSGMTFTWTSNTSGEVVSHEEDLKEVPAGLYCLEIKYECCSFYDCIEITTCAMSVVASATYSSSSTANGSAALVIANGMEPYQIQWSNGATTPPIANLAAGDYQFTVTDAYHCSAVGSVNVPLCSSIQLSVEATISAACGGTGSIKVSNVTPNGGRPPYSYQWLDTNGEPIDEPTDIDPGTYCLVVTDANGCTGIKCFQVIDGIPLSTNAIFIKELKNVSSCEVRGEPPFLDACDGAITISIEESAMVGNGAFAFEWSGPNGFTATGESIEGLCVGFYDVTISNEYGCSATRSFNICCCEDQSTKGQFPNVCPKEPFTINDEYTVVEPLTAQNNYMGSIDISISGSVYSTGYHYVWSGPNGFAAYTEDIEGLAEGRYCVTVTNGCKEEVVKCFDLGVCDAAHTPKLGIYVTNSCESGHSGTVRVSIQQAMAPYTVLWPGGSVTTLEQPYTIKGLEAGTYIITVTDAKSCSATVSATVGATPDNMYNFDFPMSHIDPFEVVDPCFRSLFNARIRIPDGFNSNCTGGLTHTEPNEYPYHLTVEWPDLSYSTLVVEDGGGCHTIGTNVFDVHTKGLYPCAVIDQYGCRKDWCFEFGEVIYKTYAGFMHTVQPPSKGAEPFKAVTECIECENCGDKDCPRDNPHDCKDKAFDYSPTSSSNPCAGGTLTVPCDNTTRSIPVGGIEYVDWDHPLEVLVTGECRYKVGCLFEGLDDPFFEGQPIYVETVLEIKNENCRESTKTPGNPYIFCLGGVNYSISEDQDCWGKVTCRQTGEVIYEGILEEFTRTCIRQNQDGSCDKLLFCTLTQPDVLLEVLEYDVECPPECHINPDYCEPCKVALQSNDRDNQPPPATQGETRASVRAYPNPFNQFLVIEINSLQEQGLAQIIISDLLGRTVWESTKATHFGTNRFTISNGDEFAPGIYYVSIKDGEGHITTKKVVRIAK